MRNETSLEILKRRALELARREETKAVKEQAPDYILFLVNNENFAIEAIYIKEVLSIKEYTKLPMTPPHIFGVVNIRRNIYSIINTKELFNIPAIEKKNASNENQRNKLRMLLIENSSMNFGLLIDEIIGIETIRDQDLYDTMPNLKGFAKDSLKGITKNHILVIDALKMLNNKSLIVNDEVKGA